MLGDNIEKRCDECGCYGPCSQIRIKENPYRKDVAVKNVCFGCLQVFRFGRKLEGNENANG